MVKTTRNKEVIGATVSPWVKKEALKIVEESGDFSSLSDLVSIAITKFITEYKEEKKREKEALEKVTKKEINNLEEKDNVVGHFKIS